MEHELQQLLRRNVLLMAGGNSVAAGALVVGGPSSPTVETLRMLAPLPIWGALLALAAALQFLDRPLVGHGVAVGAWLFIAGAAVAVLLDGRATSPILSVILTGLAVAWSGLHINGLWFRRTDQVRRRSGQREDR